MKFGYQSKKKLFFKQFENFVFKESISKYIKYILNIK